MTLATQNAFNWISGSGNTLLAQPTYSGGSFIIAGLKIDDGANVQILDYGYADGYLTIQNNLGLDTMGAIIKVGTTTASSISGGWLQPGSGQELIVTVAGTGPGGTLTISSIIPNNGSNATALTKSGPGTLVLSPSAETGNNQNTYTGPTIINEGTLQFGAVNPLVSTAGVTVYGRTAVLDINGYGAWSSANPSPLTVVSGSVINSAAGSGVVLAVGNVTLGGGPFGSSASVNVAGDDGGGPGTVPARCKSAGR